VSKYGRRDDLGSATLVKRDDILGGGDDWDLLPARL
jgi:hypothetical protein